MIKIIAYNCETEKKKKINFLSYLQFDEEEKY